MSKQYEAKIAHQGTPSTPNHRPNMVWFEPGGDSRTPTCRSASASARRPDEALMCTTVPLRFDGAQVQASESWNAPHERTGARCPRARRGGGSRADRRSERPERSGVGRPGGARDADVRNDVVRSRPG